MARRKHMMRKPCLGWIPIVTMLSAGTLFAAVAAEVLLPQNRSAFYSRESIELAVVGLARDQTATLELAAPDVEPVSIPVTGDGGTVTVALPPNTLAPAVYTIAVDGKPQPGNRITVSRRVHSSTMYVSQTGGKRSAGVNFYLSNAFSFGLLDRDRLPDIDARKRSGVLNHYEKYIADDMPAIIYMYWTGYVLHKPWGSEKEWCSPDMTENMRFFNFHVAQRLRRYRENFLLVGSLDEPGLPWGRTPAGGSASGFPGWNTKEWYEDRGWTFTDDPAGGTDADWMKYMRIRCGMLGEQTNQARNDIKTVWPSAVYSTDLYALHAIMDGTDSWNQWSNDVPSTHVFVDWGYGKLGALSGLYLEKAHDPTAKVAHAMNGQLFGSRVPQPATRYAYHLMMNSLLAGGMYSNWWLNYGGMKPDDLIAVNGPVERLGPVFVEMSSAGHDVALLWSFTELAMRLKDITAREARNASGEQIKLMIADYPETKELEDGEMVLNAYGVGSNYKLHVLAAHQALIRAGYPTHILDERTLPENALRSYRTLVIVGQTFGLPSAYCQAIEKFTASGGRVLVDEATTVTLPGATVVKMGLTDMGHRWSAKFSAKAADGKTPADDGIYQTNWWADGFARNAVGPIRETMSGTSSEPVFEHDSPWLAAERHVGGDGELQMVINTFEKLGAKDSKGLYYIYNHAPFKAEYRLKRIPAGNTVYRIEGLDWGTVSEINDPTAPQKVTFEPGEMKLYLVAPHVPAGLKAGATAADGVLRVNVRLLRKRLLGQGTMKMPWPFELTVATSEGQPFIKVYRATGVDGTYAETFSLGRNCPQTTYAVSVRSPVAGLQATVSAAPVTSVPEPETIAGDFRVFDRGVIRSFLAGKPSLVVPYASAAVKPVADRVAASLKTKGITAESRPEKDIWRKALYPRVWDPYIKVFTPEKADRPLPKDKVKDKDGNPTEVAPEVKLRVTVESHSYDTPTVKTEDGKPVSGNWVTPGTLATVVGSGFVNTHGPETFCEAGCRFFIGANRRLVLINGEKTSVKSTEHARKRWARPWQTLTHHVGAHNLVPELPEAYACDQHLVLLGDSHAAELVRALQASELLQQVADDKYPGPGKALVQFAWSPFGLGKNVVFIGYTDDAGLQVGLNALLDLCP